MTIIRNPRGRPIRRRLMFSRDGVSMYALSDGNFLGIKDDAVEWGTTPKAVLTALGETAADYAREVAAAVSE